MPSQTTASVENNFTSGLKTEFTGLNFPENAATDTDNCIYTLIGEVERRQGFDYETNYHLTTIVGAGKATSSYKWNNVGGDGVTQLYVQQVGGTLHFYSVTNSTIASPLSNNKLAATVTLSSFLVTGSTVDTSRVECQYTDGNGYLFVFHPYLEPFYCTYNAGTITATAITLKVRDFTGINEPGIGATIRPSSLSTLHNYNLLNQGWIQNPTWQSYSTDLVTKGTGSKTFTVDAGMPVIVGQAVQAATTTYGDVVLWGVVTSYSSTTLVLNITTATGIYPDSNTWLIRPVNPDLIIAWFTALGNYPSNGDQWWRFKDSSDSFDPTTTVTNVTQNSGPAPKGFYVTDVFNQKRSVLSGIVGLTDITTAIRPKTGTWFQGRVWYTGVDASQQATGTAGYTTWTENIYFSQIVENVTQLGLCHQVNDPTSEFLFDLLPTDGGTITIQGCGSIYKLFPLQNGLLVFAANGIWFITGNQGIGFTATDYTITKISAVQSISGMSFVSVLGYPVFWNEEGIYNVTPTQQGSGFSVNNLCHGTILSFYASIPLASKKYVRGDYNPINFVIQWAYRSVDETNISDRYNFNRILNLNTVNKAFYPYTIATGPFIHDVKYIAGPGGSTCPDPVFKYLTSSLNSWTFSEENNSDYEDWSSVSAVDYDSYFVTGYKLHGGAILRWQSGYVYVYNDNSNTTAYKIQGIWDYAGSGNSGKYTNIQVSYNPVGNFSKTYRRHKIRGNGLSLQLKFSSVTGLPFKIMGWAIWETKNAGV